MVWPWFRVLVLGAAQCLRFIVRTYARQLGGLNRVGIGESMSDIREVTFQAKICYLDDCLYRGTPGCRVWNLGIYGVVGCEKYKNEEDTTLEKDNSACA